MELGLVTSNAGKVRELAAALEPVGHTVAQRALEYPEVQAPTLAAVVEFGLEWLAQRHSGQALLIDDAGLFVDALGGFPGVYSRYAYDTIGPTGVLALLGDGEARSAEFRCVLGLLLPDGGRRQFRGSCRGRIAREPRGDGGFGYDPVFVPAGDVRTFAELPLAEKNALSHRGRALAALVVFLGDGG
jgi:XTP/dITP diphosphohydrolase